MPTVLTINGFRFYFYSDEGNEPCHIHVKKGDGRGKLWLEPPRWRKSSCVGLEGRRDRSGGPVVPITFPVTSHENLNAVICLLQGGFRHHNEKETSYLHGCYCPSYRDKSPYISFFSLQCPFRTPQTA